MTQAIFWIYSTISWIVFVIQKIELKSVILRCETSMKTCYPGHTDWNTTYFLVPNYELFAQILSWGREVEIVKPKSLRIKMHQMTMEISKKYSSNG